jgi:Sulfotransferase family
MIISAQRRYVFVHIPKTGGTAMALALESRAAKDDILVGDTPKARARRARLKGLQTPGRLWKHSTLADIDGLVDLSGMFIFTLVRNPWDRVVSYYHWLRGQRFDHPAVARAKALDFSSFLNHPGTVSSLQAAPYASYVTDAAGEMRASLFIRLERAGQDMAALTAHLGFAPILPVANQSARDRDWRPYYSEVDATTLARVCAPDIAQFGYCFDPTA